MRTSTAALITIRAERERAVRELRRLDLAMGRLAADTMRSDEYATKSSLGRLLGYSHTHIANLIQAAEAEPVAEPLERVPVIDNAAAGDYVTSLGSRIVRSISAFESSDVLVQSGLDPRLFADDEDIRVPYMLWQLDSGDWVGVGTATVGYGGTGCDLSRDALTRAGVSPQVADEIVRWRFCDAIDIDDRQTWLTSTRWPVHSRGIPRALDDRMIVPFGDGLRSIRTFRDYPQPSRPEIDETGFYPSVTQETNLEAWLRFLDDTDALPEWAQGTRVARVFRNDDAAASDGFAARPLRSNWGSYGSAHPCVVIEQGMVQLWGFYHRPLDHTQYLPDEAYEVLDMANAYPATLIERDARQARPWARFLSAFVPQSDGLPDRVDISPNGTSALAYLPTAPITYVS
ncbi:hypothetical protein [Plantibacter sp. CFBP 13570]|uniref:hypothetical protein n=1 Tax=Plantibacter sp. CFBP 13570 TaxID=2775272 RepID=UPI001930A68C|nr:hypothetical protein [Plantibacter sp. CFBP 13570]MBD8535690.1 hypothetical protein [Plantibacter sp. CFBP 13570]